MGSDLILPEPLPSVVKRVWQWFKVALVILAVTWLAISAHFGKKIDSICIEGRLSEAQAAAINSLPWEKCPKYRRGKCEAQVDDRVLVRECSELSRSVFMWRPWFYRPNTVP